MNNFDEFYINYLSLKCREMEDDDTKDMASKTIEAFELILKIADIARKEGLLALEEASEELDRKDETQELLFKIIQLIVDGTEPKLVERIGINRCIASNLPSYRGLINLMYVQGTLMIQAGENTRVIEEMLKSMIPKLIIDELNRHECEKEQAKALLKEESEKQMIESLCRDDNEIDEEDHSVISETAKALLKLSDNDIQRLLKETDCSTMEVAMKGLPGKARARILNNMSPRTAVMVAEDMTYMGPLRLRDVEEACVDWMKILLKLSASL